MRPRPKTIQIFLPDGNARSIRIAEITSRTVQAIQVPRSKIKDAGDRAELRGVGVYFLFGADEEDETLPVVYVGEAEDCYHRLKQHARGKDYWQSAVAVTSKTNAFTKAHAKYLEWYCHEKARESGRCRVKNSSMPAKPFIPETVEADLMDSFETLQILLSTLGFPFLEELRTSGDSESILYCRGRGAEGRGQYREDGFAVFEGSRACLETTEGAGAWATGVRERLFKSGVLREEDGVAVFTRDHLFNSPSGAAVGVLGRNANGWKAWKNEKGQTLHELEREKLEKA